MDNRSPVPIWELVIADMWTRDRIGRGRYGTPLTSETDIDTLQYLYEELLDAAVYTKRLILERDKGNANDARASD